MSRAPSTVYLSGELAALVKTRSWTSCSAMLKRETPRPTPRPMTHATRSFAVGSGVPPGCWGGGPRDPPGSLREAAVEEEAPAAVAAARGRGGRAGARRRGGARSRGGTPPSARGGARRPIATSGRAPRDANAPRRGDRGRPSVGRGGARRARREARPTPGRDDARTPGAIARRRATPSRAASCAGRGTRADNKSARRIRVRRDGRRTAARDAPVCTLRARALDRIRQHVAISALTSTVTLFTVVLFDWRDDGRVSFSSPPLASRPRPSALSPRRAMAPSSAQTARALRRLLRVARRYDVERPHLKALLPLRDASDLARGASDPPSLRARIAETARDPLAHGLDPRSARDPRRVEALLTRNALALERVLRRADARDPSRVPASSSSPPRRLRRWDWDALRETSRERERAEARLDAHPNLPWFADRLDDLKATESSVASGSSFARLFAEMRAVACAPTFAMRAEAVEAVASRPFLGSADEAARLFWAEEAYAEEADAAKRAFFCGEATGTSPNDATTTRPTTRGEGMFYSSGRAPDDSVSLARSVPDEEDEYYRRVAGALIGALARGDATGALNPRRALRALHAALDLTGEDSAAATTSKKRRAQKRRARRRPLVGGELGSGGRRRRRAARGNHRRRPRDSRRVRAVRTKRRRRRRRDVGVGVGRGGDARRPRGCLRRA